MQEKKRKKKNPAAEQEEQTKKMQSVAEGIGSKIVQIQTKTNGFRLSQYKRKPTDRLDFGRSCNLCCSVGCHAADAAASISG